MTKHKQSVLARRAEVLIGQKGRQALKARTKPPKGMTILTGKVEPIPDNRPDIKSADNRFDLFQATTIEDCTALLEKILPYWIKYQLVYPHETKLMTLDIRCWLVALRAKSDREIPPVPDDLLGIKDWITDVKRVKKTPKRKEGKKTISAEAKLCGVLALDLDKKKSITVIAREAGVARKTAYECPMFMSIYNEIHPPKTTKKGSRFSFDENRD